MRVRPATLADVDAMAWLERVAFPGDRLSTRALRRLVRRPTAICLAAEADGALAGDAVVLLRRDSGAARLYSIAVDPDRRGAGIGGALLAEAEARAAAAGRREMRLEVREDNEAALRRYRAAGYAECGRKPGFYDDGATAIAMKKSLPPLPRAAVDAIFTE